MRPIGLGFSPQPRINYHCVMDDVELLFQSGLQSVGCFFMRKVGPLIQACDQLIHPSTCVNYHPIVGIDFVCVCLQAGEGPTMDN